MRVARLCEIALVSAVASPLSAQQRLYVDADSAGPVRDGTTWATEFIDLQDAMAVSHAGDEIWVAAGTYVPGPPDDAVSSFQLPSGVALYGGFAGGETSRASRNWVAHKTTLSGDVGRDDEYVAGVHTSWNHHTNIEHSIVWGNVATGAEVSPRDAQTKGSTSFTASLVEASFYVPPGEDPPNPNDYPGCIDEDPMLVDAAGYDFQPLPGSPAINAGDASFAPAPEERDLDGHALMLCGRVDSGAFEFGIGDADCNQSVNLNDFTF